MVLHVVWVWERMRNGLLSPDLPVHYYICVYVQYIGGIVIGGYCTEVPRLVVITVFYSMSPVDHPTFRGSHLGGLRALLVRSYHYEGSRKLILALFDLVSAPTTAMAIYGPRLAHSVKVPRTCVIFPPYVVVGYQLEPKAAENAIIWLYFRYIRRRQDRWGSLSSRRKPRVISRQRRLGDVNWRDSEHVLKLSSKH